METEQVYQSLKAQLESNKTVSNFASVKSRRRSLRCFSQPLEVIAFLKENEPVTERQRSTVVASLIATAQAKEGESALIILLVAFFPALKTMQAKTWAGGRVLYEDLAGLIVESFIERVYEFNLKRLGRRAVINLIFGTRRMVWREIEASVEEVSDEVDSDQAMIEQLPSEEPLAEIQLITSEEGGGQSGVDARLLALSSRVGARKVELAQELYAVEVSLFDWVRRQNPELDLVTLTREYNRVRRLRSRLIKRLKKLTETVPIRGDFSSL